MKTFTVALIFAICTFGFHTSNETDINGAEDMIIDVSGFSDGCSGDCCTVWAYPTHGVGAVPFQLSFSYSAGIHSVYVGTNVISGIYNVEVCCGEYSGCIPNVPFLGTQVVRQIVVTSGACSDSDPC